MRGQPSRTPATPLAALGNALALLALLAPVLWLGSLHEGEWWQAPRDPGRWIAAAVATAAFVALTGWTLRRTRSPRVADAPGAQDEEGGGDWLVAWASQTGFAYALAERTADALRAGGLRVDVRELARLDAATLARFRRALFVASTTGEGDPPDGALAFVGDAMARPAALPHLAFAVLALGDREYARFCGFGHRLDAWLRRSGASPLFDLVEVDNGDAGALRHWQHHLGLLAGATDQPDWSPAPYESWTLAERRELNPGSVGEPAFHIALAPGAGARAQWQAGDIAEIGPCNAPGAVASFLQRNGLDGDRAVRRSDGVEVPLRDLLARSRLPDDALAPEADLAQSLAGRLEALPHREYSIASLPGEGTLQLVVRRMRRPDGAPGLGSGWLCEHAPPGGAIAVRIRANPNFHAPDPSRPMILVGNGTGIAGLRAHLKARVAAGAHRNWLVFGERNADRDRFHRDEIEAWLASGAIERLDLAFSRDPGAFRYVQDALRGAMPALRDWCSDGAAVYVCGRLQGMAPAVDAVLREALGDAEVEAMLDDGRYRRDVY